MVVDELNAPIAMEAVEYAAIDVVVAVDKVTNTVPYAEVLAIIAVYAK
jgi:hypothetical protein